MIGIFDSGLGGLTILKAILQKLPDYDYVYFGDSARAPYGNKSQEAIYQYTREAVDFLFGRGCHLIVLACNTASSKALRKIQQEYLPKHYSNRRVLGVIRPLVEEIAGHATIQRVGVLGTKATIASDAYVTELRNLRPGLNVCQQAAPLLVPLIEEGWTTKPETMMILKKYLRPLKQKQVQALILACTHYPFLLSQIRRAMTKRVFVPDPGEVVAKSLAAYLERHPELGIQPVENPLLEFYTTDDLSQFKQLGEKFLGQAMANVKKVNL